MVLLVVLLVVLVVLVVPVVLVVVLLAVLRKQAIRTTVIGADRCRSMPGKHSCKVSMSSKFTTVPAF